MKELFFGWLTKGQYQLSFLDSIMFMIEGIILMFFNLLYISINRLYKRQI